ncbi:EF-hand domain-containing protein [Novosphingobium bradum]|uniref:EF-hand domain-containing protein n=1 Tax=Novosphingobium bradum TaxID=1737444 RepID=A0ABV7IK10_9SPHN
MKRPTKRMTLALAATGMVALAGTAIAQQRMGLHDPFGNATITRAEAQAKAVEMFARLDVNGDGRLDAADRVAAMGKRFDAMDANHDGVLSRQEFLDAHQKMMGGHDGHDGAGGPGEHRMGGMEGMGGMGAMRAMHGMRMLGRMDTNGDHAVTRDEFLAGALKRFDTADANHDGKLTPEERRAAFRQGMKMHRQHMGGMAGHGMDHEMGDHDMGDMPPPPPAK